MLREGDKLRRGVKGVVFRAADALACAPRSKLAFGASYHVPDLGRLALCGCGARWWTGASPQLGSTDEANHASANHAAEFARAAQHADASAAVDLGALPEWNLADLYSGLDSPQLAADMAQAVAQINAEMEGLIRACPEQYLWGYARYKQPRGEF